MKYVIYLIGTIVLVATIFYFGDTIHSERKIIREEAFLGELLVTKDFKFAVKEVREASLSGINLHMYAENTSSKPMAFYSTELKHDESPSYKNYYLFVKKDPNITYIVGQAAVGFTITNPAIKINPNSSKREVYNCDLELEDLNSDKYYLAITEDIAGDYEVARILLY